MKLPGFALRHRAIFIAVVFIGSMWGAISFKTMPRREDPEYTVRVCQVTTYWPGATAEDVEHLLTDELEEAIANLDEVYIIESRSLTGFSVIDVELEDEIRPDQVDNVWDKVRAKVAAADLPTDSGVETPYVNADYGDTAAMVLAIYQRPQLPLGDSDEPGRRKYSHREMEIIADRFEDEVRLINDVGMLDLFGAQQETIYIETDVGTWSQLSLTSDELKQLLELRNIVAPGGSIDTKLVRFGVKPTGEFKADREINNLVVGTHGDLSPVYLSDLGLEVIRTYLDPPVLISRYLDPSLAGGADCIVLSFTMKAGRNVVKLGGEVRELIARAKRTWLPEDVEIAVVSDPPTAVTDKIDDFAGNLYQAVLIVVLVAFLLVGLRVAVVMAAAIPFVMLLSLGTMPFFGVELEQISIAALIIALGMLVDNAIEVCDNMLRLLEEGLSRFEAASQGAAQIGPPILIATLTTMAAFLPMLTVPGSSGEYIYSLPVVVSSTLMISWLTAMTMTTIMAYWMIRPAHGKAPLWWLLGKAKTLVLRSKPSDKPKLDFGQIYQAAAMAAIRAKYVTIAIAFGAFVAACSLVATGLVGTQYFPAADRSQFVIDVDMPEGSPIGLTDEVCKELEQIILDQRNITIGGKEVDALENAVIYVGGGGPRFYLGENPKDPGANNGFVLVNTINRQVVDSYIKAIRAEARRLIPDARISPGKLDMGPPVDYPIQLRLSGLEIEELRGYTVQLKDIMEGVDGTWDVNDSWGRLSFQMFIDTDEDKAKLAGVTNASVAQTSNAFFTGHYLTTYREEDHRVPIYLRLPAAQRHSLADVNAIYVEGKYGKVPIDAVSSIHTDWVPGKIERRNLVRTVEINARVQEGKLANSILSAAMPEVNKLADTMPPGYYIEIGGQQEETTDSQEDMSKAFSISILVIIVLLVIQYNSLIKPIIILMSVPLAATGALFGLWITGNPLGFMANLGLLSLAGIVINSAIVLIEFVQDVIRQRVAAGEDLPGESERSYCGLTRREFRKCLVTGAQMRILPIMLTTLTTVGGLIPLALFGGPLFEPMAIAIIFGLLLATALTLLVIPALLALFVETFGLNLIQETKTT